MSKIESKLKNISKAQEELRNYLSKSIDLIAQNPDVKQMSSKNCFTVSFSSLSKNNYILDPTYYNFEKQKEIVKEQISKNDDCGLKYINRILSTQKDTNNDVRFHPDFLKELQKIISE